jgi:hypothetical protein
MARAKRHCIPDYIWHPLIGRSSLQVKYTSPFTMISPFGASIQLMSQAKCVILKA